MHRLNSSIIFTAPSQTLTTLGNPKDRNRAMLVVDGEDVASAIKYVTSLYIGLTTNKRTRADCKQCSHAMIRSLVIDGNRPQLLRIPKGDALIELGNAESQTVRDCKLYEPRSVQTFSYNVTRH